MALMKKTTFVRVTSYPCLSNLLVYIKSVPSGYFKILCMLLFHISSLIRQFLSASIVSYKLSVNNVSTKLIMYDK